MDDKIEFRFVTRTLSEDFRVFGRGGRERYPDGEEFAPLRDKGDIIPEEGPCAVLYEEDGKIFLVAASLRRNTEDRAGRPIRFSFCQIFSAGRKKEAYSAFMKVTGSLPAVEEKVRELIAEIPVMRTDWRGKKVRGEDVEFRQEEFMRWLQEGQKTDLKLRQAKVNHEYPIGSAVWPPEGAMLKWTENDPEIITCSFTGPYDFDDDLEDDTGGEVLHVLGWLAVAAAVIGYAVFILRLI